ncbi:N-6 DNA methylase [Campylobacter lari]|uniref:HsdM family class I SAM-dependent methyltransferase n=1 Tax=Campylobacter lari TaxID=201 RepID=UPI001BD91807|nr:N-6 DNA methylase [Campylobacter lari]MBT0821024.1 N-6 DNA methylase [Campylobacter lari]
MTNKCQKKTISNIIKNAKKYLDENTLVSTLIMFFATKNKISISGNECIKYNKFDLLFLKKLEFQLSVFGIYELIYSFECIIDNKLKKNYGIVYTPNFVTKYIINYCLKQWKNKNIPICCDPCCGSGSFLIECITQLSHKYNMSLKESLQYIKGIDIDSKSVSYCKIIIELFLQNHNEELQSLDNTIICADTLLCDESTIFKKLGISHIDILVTNPPYVKLQNIEKDYKNQLINKYTNFASGSFSTAILFLLASEKLLKKSKGILGCITQNNLFTSLAAANIRSWLCENKYIHTIIDFRDKIIFNNISAYTCLLFLDFSKTENINFSWNTGTQESLRENISFSSIQTKTLNPKKWRLAPSIHLDNIHKIEQQMPLKLKDIVDIKVGFATLKDSVFLLKTEQICNFEKDILKKAIKISEINSESDLHHNQRYIIFPYKIVNGQYQLIDEYTMKKQYPLTYSYFLQNKKTLENRSGSDNSDLFYSWGRKQGMQIFQEKLITKTFNISPNFILDTTGSLFCNGYALIPKIQLDISVLKKILNSQVMNYYMKITSFNIEGNYQCFQKNFIENFGIPNLSKHNIEFISTHNDEELEIYLIKLYNLNRSVQDFLLEYI